MALIAVQVESLAVVLATLGLPVHTAFSVKLEPPHFEAIFTFLDQTEYTRQVGVTPMTDYRFAYKADFDLCHLQKGADRFFFGLLAVKPSRISV